MQDDVGQPGDAPQGGWVVEVGNQRAGALGAPERALRRIAEQGVDPIVAKQQGKRTAREISAADDE